MIQMQRIRDTLMLLLKDYMFMSKLMLKLAYLSQQLLFYMILHS